MRGSSMSPEALDSQTRRAYSSDRLPGTGADRNALGKAGRRRLRDGRCTECGEPILGRAGNATTCLVHRQYPGPLSRADLVALLAEHEAVVASLREALVAVDEEDVA